MHKRIDNTKHKVYDVNDPQKVGRKEYQMMKTRTTLMIEEEALRTIKTYAARLGISVSAFMVQCTMRDCMMMEQTMEKLLTLSPHELAEYKKSMDEVFGNVR